MGLFLRQLWALLVKNLITLKVNWLSNVFSFVCLLGLGIVLGFIPDMLSSPDVGGIGSEIPIFPIAEAYDPSMPLVWADTTNGAGFVTGQQIMDQVMTNFTSRQRASVKRVATSVDINDDCLVNFIGASRCFIGIVFDFIPTNSLADTRPFNYTLILDWNHEKHNVRTHEGHNERRRVPMQWAIDQAIIKLSTGQDLPIVTQRPAVKPMSTKDLDQTKRGSFLRFLKSFLLIIFATGFTGIVQSVIGGVALERSKSLTAYQQSMGAMDSARILAWYIASLLPNLPLWIIYTGIWHVKLLPHAGFGNLLIVNLVTGLALGSWSFFVSVFFKKNAQIAATTGILASVLLVIVPMTTMMSGLSSAVLSFLVPTVFLGCSLQSFAIFDQLEVRTSFTAWDLENKRSLLPALITTIISIIVWPVAAVYLERVLYKVSNPINSRENVPPTTTIAPGLAVSIRNLRKVFQGSMWRSNSKTVVAVEDLTLDVPDYGIFVLLGPNGAGKSTTLSILSGLDRPTAGEIVFAGNRRNLSHGDLGIVPQQNVLFEDLTCYENLLLWNAIKSPDERCSQEGLEELIRDCDLQEKLHERAGTMSGGQKRKLQLALGLVGGSKLILVDEATSGVDPLSRRSLWRTLTKYRTNRTIVLTTHFLDEADFLADRIAVLAAPGKLIACDTPVALKTSRGDGYSVVIKLQSNDQAQRLLQELLTVAPATTLTLNNSAEPDYHLHTTDSATVACVLRRVDGLTSELGVVSYDLVGTTIESIFLDLLKEDEKEKTPAVEEQETKSDTAPLEDYSAPIELSNGRHQTPFAQALTIFHKRLLISRRSWILAVLPLAVGIAGAIWPTASKSIFDVDGSGCGHQTFRTMPPRSYFHDFWLSNYGAYAAPPSLDADIRRLLPELYRPYGPWDNNTKVPFMFVADKQAVMDGVAVNMSAAIGDTSGSTGLAYGLVADAERGDYFVLWDARLNGYHYFSVLSNILFDRARNSTTSPATGSRKIIPSEDGFARAESGRSSAILWLLFFSAALSIYPAIFAIHIARERQSNVQVMHISNGISNPLGLWLGHLLFDFIFVLIISTVVVAYYLTQPLFRYLGLLWFIMILYGIVATLLAYVVAVLVKTPLGAFGMTAASQFLSLGAYMGGILGALRSMSKQDTPYLLSAVYYGLAVVSPVNSIARAGMVSSNLYATLCDNRQVATGVSVVSMDRFGGPILILFIWLFFLLSVLTWIDGGFRLRLLPFMRASKLSGDDSATSSLAAKDVIDEAKHAADPSTTDPLRVVHVSKNFGGNKVVNNVSFTIPEHGVFVMLGPNGAGKTTTFDMIHGKHHPSSGDVFVNEKSIVRDPRNARISFGVCPQFSAIDAHLTVRQHLYIYGRLKGLRRGEEINNNITELMRATSLTTYADRLATKLSGGNKRKLSLAIALIGNPSVILVDEYSTGIDAKTKRELWAVLKQATKHQSVFLTTHSLEEASYLGTKVGVMSKRMLAVGKPTELESRNASYEVHFSCRTPSDFTKAKNAMAKIPGATMAEDIATRFEVPIGYGTTGVRSVADLVELLSKESDVPDYMVGKSSLETAFIRILNESNDGDAFNEKDAGIV